MEWLQRLLGEQWNIQAAGGATGEAYVGTFANNRIFLKRNSSPFLAVLSVEGIVPKLLWTKRLENGDVVTAQEYLVGTKLTPEEMKGQEIALFLQKIHRSKELLTMLRKIRIEVECPEAMLSKLALRLSEQLLGNDLVQQSLAYLEQSIPTVPHSDYVVCHCDLSHHNCLKDQAGKLFLVDWDGAVVADLAKDIGILLHYYVPKDEWDNWLEIYGLERTETLEHRFKWYTIIHILTCMELSEGKEKIEQMGELLQGILS